MKPLRILVACEFSGIVRDAFKAKDHDAWSCDLLPTEKPGNHIQGDVLAILRDGWDLMIAHPPCTHLAVSGARWFKDKKQEQAEALSFVLHLLCAPIEQIALENPISIISTRIRKPDQIIQPYWFGDSVQKATCLWLKNLPLLQPTKIVDRGLIYVDPHGNKHGGVHTMRGLKAYSPLMLLPRNEERWKIRSRTFQGIADAMATQWGTIP